MITHHLIDIFHQEHTTHAYTLLCLFLYFANRNELNYKNNKLKLDHLCPIGTNSSGGISTETPIGHTS